MTLVGEKENFLFPDGQFFAFIKNESFMLREYKIFEGYWNTEKTFYTIDPIIRHLFKITTKN